MLTSFSSRLAIEAHRLMLGGSDQRILAQEYREYRPSNQKSNQPVKRNQ